MPQSFAPLLGSVVANPSASIAVAPLFTFSTANNNPTYIDVTAFDRNEYPYALLPKLGYFQANGYVVSEINTYSDHYGAGIIYTLQTNGSYYNSKYGYLSDLNYIASSTQYDNTYLTIVGSNGLSVLGNTRISGTSIAISQDAQVLAYNAAYNNTPVLGSIDIVTGTAISTSAPSQATPKSIVATANAFIGQVWNNEGCWILASNIAAKSGSSLPITTSLSDGSACAIANGEWIVVYNGANQSLPTIFGAESYLLPGDMLTVAWSLTGPNKGGGHIATVVSGSGLNAVVVDNIRSTGVGGNVVDANDVYLKSHSLDSALLYNQAIASSMVIYRLDTPTITVNIPSYSLVAGQSIKLGSFFTATDAGGAGSLPITQYKFYDVGNGSAINNQFIVNGTTHAAHAADTSVVTVDASQLSSLILNTANGLGGSDTIYVSAYNGSYWGDFSSFSLLESTSSAPVNLVANAVYKATANQMIVGSAGVETIVFNSVITNFVITSSGSSVIAFDNSGLYGTQTLVNIERLQFTDTKLALDTATTQAAGQTALLLGAALPGTLALDPTKQALVGAVIGLFDAGFTLQQLSGALLRLPVWDALTNHTNATAADIATYLVHNAYGGTETAAITNAAIAAMTTETPTTQGTYLASLAQSSTGQSHIGLVGLQTSGLAYV